MAVVGWGEEPDPTTGGTVKYWIVRNSWGPQWGEGKASRFKHCSNALFLDGYFKILRGQNFRGIENQSVYIDPDIQRGYLKKRRQFFFTCTKRLTCFVLSYVAIHFRFYSTAVLQRLMTEENRSKEKNLTFAFQRVRSHNFISR